MGPSSPELSAGQLRRGARNAAQARAVRGQALRELRQGERDVASLLALADRGRVIARMRVFDVVKALRGVGPVGARRVLSGIGIEETRRLGGLGLRQRRELIAVTGYPVQWRRNFHSTE